MLVGGKVVAGLVDIHDPPIPLSCVVSTSDKLTSPGVLTVARAGESVTTTTGYGTSNAHLQPDELVRLTMGGAEAVIGALEGGLSDRMSVRGNKRTAQRAPHFDQGFILGV